MYNLVALLPAAKYFSLFLSPPGQVYHIFLNYPTHCHIFHRILICKYLSIGKLLAFFRVFLSEALPSICSQESARRGSVITKFIEKINFPGNLNDNFGRPFCPHTNLAQPPGSHRTSFSHHEESFDGLEHNVLLPF